MALELVPLLGGVVANRMLRSWAERSGTTAKKLHATQKWSIVVAFVVALATPPLVMTTEVLGVLPLGGLALGTSFLLTAALLGLYALRTART